MADDNYNTNQQSIGANCVFYENEFVLLRSFAFSPFLQPVNNMKPIRVALVDDDVALSNKVKEVFASDNRFDLIGTASSIESGYRISKEKCVDVMIIDIRLSSHDDGLQLVKVIHREKLVKHLIVWSAYDDSSVVTELLRLGVHGFLLKNQPHNTLPDQVMAVFRGGALIAPEALARLIDAHSQNMKTSALYKLVAADNTDFQILRSLVNGQSITDIASTVARHNDRPQKRH